MNKQITILILAAVLLFTCTQKTHAYTVYCTNCSTQWTQALDRVTNVEQLSTAINQYGQAVSQTEQQIRMVQQNLERYQNMLQNTKNLSPDILSTLSGEFRKLGDLQRQLKLQRGDMDSMQKAYQDLYPGFDDISGQSGQQYQERWQKWSAESDRAYQATFQATGRQLKDLEDQQAFDSKVQQLLQTPEGRMEAMQSANQLSAMMLRENREMRSLMNTWIQAQVQGAAKAEKEAQATREADLRLGKVDRLINLDPMSSKPLP